MSDQNNNPNVLADNNSQEISLLPLVKIFIKNRYFIIFFIFIGLILGLTRGFLSYSKSYRAESIILLQSPQKVTSGDYSKIYFDQVVQNTALKVITSASTIRDLVMQEYSYEKDGKPIKSNLLVFYDNNNLNAVVESVSNTVKSEYDKKNQLLTISYISSNPDVAAQIVNNIILQINKFYDKQMNSDALRNLEYVSAQTIKSKEELDAARQKVAFFIKQNIELSTISNDEKAADDNKHQFAKLELKKLQEDAMAKESLYNSLVKKSQDIGILSNQSAPSVIVVQEAFPPANPLPRGMLKSGIICAFLMFILALVIVLMRNISEIFGTNENIMTIIISALKKDLAKIGLFRK